MIKTMKEKTQFRIMLLDYATEELMNGIGSNAVKRQLMSMFGATEGQAINTISRYYFNLKKINADKTLENLALAQNNLMVTQKVLVKQRNLLNKDTNILAFRELLLDGLKDNLIVNSADYKNTKQTKVINTDKEIMYIIGDEHFRGKEDLPHLNKMFSIIEEDIKTNKHKNVLFAFLGDGIDGIIHTGAISSNDGAISPLLEYCKCLIYWLKRIQPQNIIYVSTSNHTQTRPLGSSRNEFAREDLNLVIIEMLKSTGLNVLSGDIITYKNACFFHGHQGWARSKEKIIENFAKTNIEANLIFMGHFHNFKINNYGKDKWLVCCPAVKNFENDWDKDNGFYNQSRFLKVTREYGEPTFNIIRI